MSEYMTIDIDALKPGRQIDELVAEKVMGWKPHTVDGKVLWTHNETRQWSVTPDHLPRYSTDIRQAWNVVMCMRFFESIPQAWYVDGVGDCFSALFRRGANAYRAKAATAPEAICKAALRNVGAGQ